MYSKILRENSQIIAASVLSAFAGLSIFPKIYEGSLRQDYFEFRTKNDNYMGMSIKEEEKAKKFLYRLDQSAKVDFFRSNTINFITFGYNKLRQGSQIGLSVSYFVKDKQELLELSPPSNFHNYLGQKVNYNEIENKLGLEKLNEFQENLILSDDAKMFGLGHAIAESNHFFISCIENAIDSIAIATAYIVSYSRSRLYKMQFMQRKRLYIISGTVALAALMAGRVYSTRLNDQISEKQACGFGLDCCEGSIEYYEKMANRNKILRHVLEDGLNLIDEEGNHLKQGVRIPFTEKQLFFKNFSLTINERKTICQSELNKLVQKLDNENELKKTVSQEAKVDKELKIFKLLRLKLESLKTRSER